MRRLPMLKRRALAWSLILAGVVVILPAVVQAQATTFSIESIGSQIGVGGADLRQTIINIIRWVLGFITLVAVGYLIYGGVLWMTAAGREQQVEKAKRVILQALIGLVIILLAWAIVAFVARTIARTTSNTNNNGGPNGCIGLNCPQPPLSDFNVIGIASCAQRPEYDENVPLASNVAITFNARVDADTVKTAVEDSGVAPNLIIEKCLNAPTCDQWGTPHPINSQVFTAGSKATGTEDATKAEWVVNRNALTFYHLSFSDDPNDQANNRWFEPQQTYRVAIPKNTASTALKDLKERALKRCEQAALVPIEGGGCDDSRDDVMYWTFSTGTDANGPALDVARTVPTSTYKDGVGAPDRNVSRKPILGVEFGNAIDSSSLDTANFQVFKLTAPPNLADRASWQIEAAPVDPAWFDFDYTSTGAFMTLIGDHLLEPFTWYMVSVRDVRNLCGTLQLENPYEWVFQTNDAVPGVKLVYPTSQNACPATEVFIQFATPMWKPGNFDCQVGASGSYVRSGSLTPNPGRTFGVVNNYDPADPNRSCTKYAFTTTDILLSPNRSHSVAVSTDLVIDQAGTRLSRNWSFRTATAETCVQEPYISRVSPTNGPAGECLSVIGNYFSDAQDAGDAVTLTDVDQPVLGWSNKTIVTRVTPTGLTENSPQRYKVLVNYPALNTVLESNEETFFLDSPSGPAGIGPCLVSLNPNNGRVGTGVDAVGENLGAAPGTVNYQNGVTVPWNISQASWSQTRINNMSVASGSAVGDGFVHVVRDDGRRSNEVAFSVEPETQPGETVPRVVEDTRCDADQNIIPSPNPKRNDSQACRNTQVTARFTVAMSESSVEAPDAIILEKCNPTCNRVAASVDFLPDRAFALTPSQLPLDENTVYRVTVSTAVTSAAGEPMATPYTWQFTTTSGANCAVSSLSLAHGVAQGTATAVSGSTYTFRTTPYGVAMSALALGAECRTIDNASVNFAWTTEPDPNNVIRLTSTTGQSIAALNTLDPDADRAGARAGAQGRRSGLVSVIHDPSYCTTNADCASNAYGACTGSVCENNRCTPVVTAVEPNRGPIGTYATVRGCWFGTYSANASRVTFVGDTADSADDQDGRSPDPLICGSPSATWKDHYIIREVPNAVTLETADDAATGPVRVTRSDGKTADGPVFTVNTDPLPPNLCRANPTSGPPTTAVTLHGTNFGSQDAADSVTLTPVAGAAQNMTIVNNTWSATSIGTTVPGTAATDPSDIHVKKDTRTSNPLPFNVLDPAATNCTQICSDDSQCPAGQGCGSNFCCSAKPRLLSTSPVTGSTNVCRNAQLEFVFDQPIRVGSAAVEYFNGPTTVNGRVSVEADRLRYNPGLLSATTAQRAFLNNDVIKNTQGVRADLTAVSGCQRNQAGPQGTQVTVSVPGSVCFTTGPDICRLARVEVTVTPSSFRFNTRNQTQIYTATGYAANGNQLSNQPGVYSWTWGWRSADNGVVTAALNGSTTDSVSTATVTARGNGSTNVIAAATVTEDTSGGTVPTTVEGRGRAIVEFCDNPWTIGPSTGFTDSATNCTAGGSCDDYHFSLSYCRGQGTTGLLPNFDYLAVEGQRSAGNERLKTIFFKEDAATRDAIGMLIYANPEMLSPRDWYRERFSDPPGSPTVIAGYPAIRTGTGAVIGATDLFDSNNDNVDDALRGIIFWLDYTSNAAQPATKNIFERFLSSLQFNTNMADIDQRGQLVRDTQRRQDLSSLRLKLEAYEQSNGSYPNLSGGSYLAGMSTSVWPSWQQALGNSLGSALPSDPIDRFDPACTAPTVPAGDRYEAGTCWSESTRRFQCPGNSHIYAYQSSGSSFSLLARMEYSGPGAFANLPGPAANLCGQYAGSNCSCFNYRVTP